MPYATSKNMQKQKPYKKKNKMYTQVEVALYLSFKPNAASFKLQMLCMLGGVVVECMRGEMQTCTVVKARVGGRCGKTPYTIDAGLCRLDTPLALGDMSLWNDLSIWMRVCS